MRIRITETITTEYDADPKNYMDDDSDAVPTPEQMLAIDIKNCEADLIGQADDNCTVTVTGEIL